MKGKSGPVLGTVLSVVKHGEISLHDEVHVYP